MTRPLVIALALVAATRPAAAGACLDLADDTDDLHKLEAFAARKGKQKQPDDGNKPWLCVELAMGNDAIIDGSTGNYDKVATRRLHERAIAACTKVLDRDDDPGECVVIVAAGGLVKVGGHDIFALVGKLPEDPIENAGGLGWTRTMLYGAMNDPRSAAAVVEMWKAAIPRADRREKLHRGSMADWSGWRQDAAGVLGKLGGADEKAFLEEQALATKDKYVAQACRDAAAAIAKRLSP
ncbi:MAG TPA: hypothetical protein VMJ10_09500 [Kofleriaceae bacterium]|nr:hypothetical protein [Kofleriaceae bacterium]